MTDGPRLVEIRPRVDSETVSALRDLLRRAEAGQIVSLLALCECPDGGRIHVSTPCRDSFALLAELARLIHLHQRRMDNSRTDVPPAPA